MRKVRLPGGYITGFAPPVKAILREMGRWQAMAQSYSIDFRGNGNFERQPKAKDLPLNQVIGPSITLKKELTKPSMGLRSGMVKACWLDTSDQGMKKLFSYNFVDDGKEVFSLN
jgi:hypothetical protein